MVALTVAVAAVVVIIQPVLLVVQLVLAVVLQVAALMQVLHHLHQEVQVAAVVVGQVLAAKVVQVVQVFVYCLYQQQHIQEHSLELQYQQVEVLPY
jgi:hypothetical protein